MKKNIVLLLLISFCGGTEMTDGSLIITTNTSEETTTNTSKETTTTLLEEAIPKSDNYLDYRDVIKVVI